MFLGPQIPLVNPGQSVLKIHFFIVSGLKMIQFKIQFKTKSKIFIQKNIHSIEYGKFNKSIHSKEFEENHSILKKGQNMVSEPSWAVGFCNCDNPCNTTCVVLRCNFSINAKHNFRPSCSPVVIVHVETTYPRTKSVGFRFITRQYRPIWSGLDHILAGW